MKTDRELKQDVMDELSWDPSINDTGIGVEVNDGIVTLTGHLSSYAEKYSAERATQRLIGVHGVAMEIDVRLCGLNERTDSEIAHTVSQALGWNSWLTDGGFKVTVEKGWITLSGEVDHEFQRTVAENVLRNLMGVVGISNQISVKPAIMPKDVKAQIEAALQRRAHADAQSIAVSIDGDEVTLSGGVLSLTESRAAVRAAGLAPGVTRVVDKMFVI
jgi:osmotically-inducible protein OsmY